MAYDPFAPPPGLGGVASNTPPLPMPLPMPPTLAPNNALASTMGDGNQVMQPGGGTTGAPLPGTAAGGTPPGTPATPTSPDWANMWSQIQSDPSGFRQYVMSQRQGGNGFQMGQHPFLTAMGFGGPGGYDMNGFRQALTDWRGQRPAFQPGAGPGQFQDWRSQRPTFRSFSQSPIVPGQGMPPPAPGTANPGLAPTGVMPINPNAGGANIAMTTNPFPPLGG